MSQYFEFPQNDLDKQTLIEKHAKKRRQWV